MDSIYNIACVFLVIVAIGLIFFLLNEKLKDFLNRYTAILMFIPKSETPITMCVSFVRFSLFPMVFSLFNAGAKIPTRESGVVFLTSCSVEEYEDRGLATIMRETRREAKLNECDQVLLLVFRQDEEGIVIERQIPAKADV